MLICLHVCVCVDYIYIHTYTSMRSLGFSFGDQCSCDDNLQERQVLNAQYITILGGFSAEREHVLV